MDETLHSGVGGSPPRSPVSSPVTCPPLLEGEAVSAAAPQQARLKRLQAWGWRGKVSPLQPAPLSISTAGVPGQGCAGLALPGQTWRLGASVRASSVWHCQEGLWTWQSSSWCLHAVGAAPEQDWATHPSPQAIRSAPSPLKPASNSQPRRHPESLQQHLLLWKQRQSCLAEPHGSPLLHDTPQGSATEREMWRP